jgi:Transposase IS66 family
MIMAYARAAVALAVYLVVFQHVPVERCRRLISDVTGAVVSDVFIHSCLAKAASLAADVVALIRTLITAAPVAGFDETTLRSGPAGDKKYVRPPGQRRHHPGPPGHPQLHRHCPQARQERHRRPARPHARQALATASTSVPAVTTDQKPRHPHRT